MPGEDGMQIARRLREESRLAIIMLTGRKDGADRVMGLELGADDYQTKPLTIRACRFAGFELNVLHPDKEPS
jgi:two-component system OmpR family response regulator